MNSFHIEESGIIRNQLLEDVDLWYSLCGYKMDFFKSSKKL